MGIIAAMVVGVVAAAGSAIMGAKGAKAMGKAQTKAAELQADRLRKTEEEMAPWQTVGKNALNAMARATGIAQSDGSLGEGADFSQFYESPGYEYRLKEGIKAVERSNAARGTLQSGPAMKEIQRYGEGLASNEFGAWYDRLEGMSTQGERAATNMGQMRQEGTNQQAKHVVGFGEARASGYNAIAGGIQAAGSALSTGFGDLADKKAAGGGGLGTGMSAMQSQAPRGMSSASMIPVYR